MFKIQMQFTIINTILILVIFKRREYPAWSGWYLSLMGFGVLACLFI
jgi:hypothetical protein